MKAETMRELAKEELEKQVIDLKNELKDIRFGKAKGEIKNPLKKRLVKREIARALTIMKQKGWS